MRFSRGQGMIIEWQNEQFFIFHGDTHFSFCHKGLLLVMSGQELFCGFFFLLMLVTHGGLDFILMSKHPRKKKMLTSIFFLIFLVNGAHARCLAGCIPECFEKIFSMFSIWEKKHSVFLLHFFRFLQNNSLCLISKHAFSGLHNLKRLWVRRTPLCVFAAK